MLLFLIFLIAIVNLAVGYVLGAGKLPPIPIAMPDLSSFFKRSIPEEVEEEESLTQPVETTATTEQVEAAPSEEPRKATQAELIAGLTDFRDKLTNVSLELKLSQEDSERFGKCATKLQSVNHEYLEHTSEVLDSLDGDDSVAATEAHDEMQKSADEAKVLSEKIDGLLDEEMTDEVRSALIETSQEIRDNAVSTQENASQAAEKIKEERELAAQEAAEDTPAESAADEQEEDASAEPSEEEPIEDESGLSLDGFFDILERALEAAADDQPLYIAEVKLDPMQGSDDAPMLTGEASARLAELLPSVIDETHTHTHDKRQLMLLAGDPFDAAVVRLQVIQETLSSFEFAGESDTLQASCTGIVVEAQSGDSRDAILSMLEEAIDEASKVGPGTLMHHDRAIPTEITSAAEVAV